MIRPPKAGGDLVGSSRFADLAGAYQHLKQSGLPLEGGDHLAYDGTLEGTL